MKKASKAALLSALIFPGAGHFYLKKYLPGVVLFGVALFGFSQLITDIVEKSLLITEQIQTGTVPLDVKTITGLLATTSSGNDVQSINIIGIILLVCWLAGIIDSYRIGRIQDSGGD